MKTECVYERNQRPAVDSSNDVYGLLKDYQEKDREFFIAFYLDSRNGLIAQNVVSIGGLNSSIVHPREIFKYAVLNSANSIILIHNHPSGNSKPSQDDIMITKKLVKAGEIMGIPVLDHVVIGFDSFHSMNENKDLRF